MPSGDGGSGDNETVKVEGIKTIQAAKEYLIANFADVKASHLPNGEAVKKVAAEKKVLFVDLP